MRDIDARNGEFPTVSTTNYLKPNKLIPGVEAYD